jgi:hypothetical protein
MKKLLNLHGVGAFLSVLVFASLLAPGFWLKLLVVCVAVAIQVIQDSFNSFLSWDEYDSFDKTELKKSGSANFIRNVWFSFVRILALIFIISYGLYYGSTEKLSWTVGLLGVVIPIIWFMSYYGKNLLTIPSENDIAYSDSSLQKLRSFITIFFLSTTLVMVYLNFGTWYVWLSSLLAIIILINRFIVDVVEGVKFKKIKKMIIVAALVAPVVIGIVSTIYQFWTKMWDLVGAFWMWLFKVSEPVCDAIAAFFTYRINLGITSVGVWLMIIIIIVVLIILGVIRDYLNYLDSNRKIAAEKIRIAKEKAEAERLKLEKEETRKENIIKVLYSLAHDIPISKAHLIYLAKNVHFVANFPVKKLTKFDFEEMFMISDVKKKIIWEHDLQTILEMYSIFFKNSETDDEELASIIEAVSKLCKFIEQYKDYQHFDVLKAMLDKSTTGIPPQWQK